MRAESVMPKNRFASVAVSGQATTPENKANQPFVSGSGPFVSRSERPPPPATMAQAQATSQASNAIHLRRVLPEPADESADTSATQG
jgi:hypothetical protein